MEKTFEELRGFIDGAITALHHRLEINEDKDLSWEVGNVDGKTHPLTVITFKWVEFWTVEDEEPHFKDDRLWLDGTEKPSKIIKDIEDILERIDKAEIEHKSKAELLADAYFG